MPEQRCPACAGHPDPLYRQFVRGVSLGHDAYAHRIYSILWWGGVRSVSQFHDMDEEDLRAVPGLADARVRLVLERREYPGNGKSPVGLLRRAAGVAEGMQAPWAQSLADAFKAAAENHAYCRRINTQRPDRVPEMPDPTAEELVNVARLLIEHEGETNA